MKINQTLEKKFTIKNGWKFLFILHFIHPRRISSALCGLNILFLIVNCSLEADTHNAASCSYADVSAQITAASTGDTVSVPAGSATWSSGFSIGKGISLIGAGIGNTVIVGNYDGALISYYPADADYTANSPFRVSGFTFDLNNKSHGIILGFSWYNYTPQTKIRIDHNRFTNQTNTAYHTIINYGMRGVVDSNLFDHIASNFKSNWGNAQGWWDNWQGIVFGATDNNMYFEDNIFTELGYGTTYAGLCECQESNRYAYRYNTITSDNKDAWPLMDMHGNQSPGFYGCFGGEIYGNQINAPGHYIRFLDQRGGKAVVFYNNGNVAHLAIQVREEFDDSLNPTPQPQPQHVSDSYYWGNRQNLTGAWDGAYVYTAQMVGDIPLENRDFFQDAASFNGTSGIGCGPMSGLPATCTTGVAYWVTNQSCANLTGMVGANPATPISGTLYKCTATNTWTPYFTPLAYPHPLRGGADTTPPSAPAVVRDGTSVTLDFVFTYSTSQLSANWDAGADAQSGISGYKYAIGTAQGATNITNGWIPVGNVTTVTKTGLTLTVGTTYYFSVKAINGESLESSATNSNGQYSRIYVFDTTGPIMGAVRDGTGADIGSTSLTTQLSANWDAATDPETGVNMYSYAIGTAAGGSNIRGWTNAGTNLSVTATGLGLTVGQVYYFSVKAQNTDGYWGTAANSNGQQVAGDTTPPSAPAAVRDGTSVTVDLGFTFSTTTLQANWTASIDAESGIAKYYYAIGTIAGGANITGWTDNGTTRNVTKTGLTLTLGTTYYFSVKAENGNGFQGNAANSNGQYVVKVDTTDTTPPTNIVSVRDGTGSDVDSIPPGAGLTTQLSANWDSSADAKSGIAKYWYAISSNVVGSSWFVDWTDNGQLTSVTRTGLTLTVGATYYFSVKAQNGAGLQSAVTNSNGQCVVSSPEQLPPVISNVSANVTGTVVTITWDTDKQATSKVEYGLDVTYGSLTQEDIVLVTNHSVLMAGLSAGRTYHYRVISRDNSGRAGMSLDYDFDTSAGGEEPRVKVFPNPYSFSNGGVIKFKVGSAGSEFGEVKIYTIRGNVARTLKIENGTVDWDGTNEDGQKVEQGVYLYKITENNGDKVTGKIAVVK